MAGLRPERRRPDTMTGILFLVILVMVCIMAVFGRGMRRVRINDIELSGDVQIVTDEAIAVQRVGNKTTVWVGRK